jgi:hypothetical protein
MVQYSPDKTLSLLTGGKQFGQKVGFIIVSVDIRRPPLIPGSTFTYKMVSDALTLLFQDRVGNATARQYGLVIPMNVRGTLAWDTHHS